MWGRDLNEMGMSDVCFGHSMLFGRVGTLVLATQLDWALLDRVGGRCGWREVYLSCFLPFAVFVALSCSVGRFAAAPSKGADFPLKIRALLPEGLEFFRKILGVEWVLVSDF